MWMDLESAGQSELSEREKQILYINVYMCNLKKNVRNLFAGQE